MTLTKEWLVLVALVTYVFDKYNIIKVGPHFLGFNIYRSKNLWMLNSPRAHLDSPNLTGTELWSGLEGHLSPADAMHECLDLHEPQNGLYSQKKSRLIFGKNWKRHFYVRKRPSLRIPFKGIKSHLQVWIPMEFSIHRGYGNWNPWIMKAHYTYCTCLADIHFFV